MPLPIIGNLHQFGKSEFVEYKDMEWLRKKYGDVATFWAADMPVVVIQDYELLQDTVIKEADTFSGRYLMGKFAEHLRKGDFGIIFTDGDLWKEHRRFALQVFRNFGMGKGLMEEKINIELGYFLESVEESIIGTEAEVDLVLKTEITVANVINQLLFGFAYHDPKKVAEFTRIKDVIAEHMHLGTYPSVVFLMHFPDILRHFPFFKNRYKIFTSGYYEIVDYCREQIRKHQENFTEEGEPTDYTDAYLKEAKKRPETFTEEQLVNILYDMFIAGQETTANTVIFTFIYALNYPEAQKKVHEELDRVIGSDRRITLSDRNSLPYVNAFIFECQRMVNLLAQNLPHKTLKKTIVNGYSIPLNTVVIPQISAVLYDEKYFPNSREFKPERFIDEEGHLKKIEQFIPFSLGKRQCLGESLARMELYILIANFFNHYELKPLNGQPPAMKKKRGVTVQPIPFTCIVRKRY